MPNAYILQKGELIDLKSKGFYSVNITPDLAVKWLIENFPSNRKRAISNVRYLASQMGNGKWRADHPDAILFNERGEMFNGQHRLEAVIESGCTTMMRVETGCDPELYEKLDSGMSRKLQDRVKFHDNHRLNTIVIQLVNSLRRRERGYEASGNRTSPEVAHEIYESHKAALQWVAGVFRQVRSVSKTPVLLALVDFYERDPIKADQFATTLLSPNGEGPVQQARVLRDLLIRRGNEKADERVEMYMLAVSAMKSFMIGREVKRIVPSEWGD